MFKFLHAADLHLDSPMRNLERYEGAPAEDLRLATRRAFENLVELALQEQVAFVLVAGDLYDSDWKDYNAGLYFIKQIQRLREADVRVYLIRGNHDALNRMTRDLPWPDNARFLDERRPETVRLEDLGVAIHGQGFENASVRVDLSARYPDPIPGLFNIGLLHTSLDGREGHDDYAPCKPEDLRLRGYDYWALGHVHQRDVVCEGPYIVFPGNTQGRHIRETGPKGCVLVTVSDAGEAALEFRPLDVARWRRVQVDVADLQREDEVLDSVRRRLELQIKEEEGRILVGRLELINADAPRIDLERWTNAIRGLAMDFAGQVWVEKVEWLDRRRPRPTQSASPALAALNRTYDEIARDPERLDEFAQSLSEFAGRLRSEVGDEMPMDDDDLRRRWIRSALDEAAEELFLRLDESNQEDAT